MKLIQLPTQAFEQRLKEEMVENPALEGGDDNEFEYEKTSMTPAMSMTTMMIMTTSALMQTRLT